MWPFRRKRANDASTHDQRFVALWHEVKSLQRRIDQLEAIAETQAQQVRTLSAAVAKLSIALGQYEGDGK